MHKRAQTHTHTNARHQSIGCSFLQITNTNGTANGTQKKATNNTATTKETSQLESRSSRANANARALNTQHKYDDDGDGGGGVGGEE